MANVTGDSAQEVSSYMTAIWNNYSQGADDIERFGDVMAELGARTASSSSEIADGLQQFVSIGPVVGLSFDYAASALATVSSSTRESANTIGNAFKSIFSRIQGLKLGETLEDGTDLNKYSQALEKVGISIKDEMGNLKDMDIILDEMMDKWDTLARDEQVALAQTVGGTYQYARLMSLMEAKDEFYKNLDYAYNAEGTIEEQLIPYEEAWTAAANQFQASLERLYESFEVKEVATGFYDFADDIVTGAAVAIENLGGVETLLTGIGAFVMGKFSTQIGIGFTNFTNNIKNAINSEKYLEQVQQESLAVIRERLALINDPIERQHLQNYYDLIQVQTSLIDNTTRLNEVEKAWNAQTIQGIAESIEALNQYQIKLSEVEAFADGDTFEESDYWNHLPEGGLTYVDEIATRKQLNQLGSQYVDMDLFTLSGEFIELTKSIESASVARQHFQENMNIAFNTNNLSSASETAKRLLSELKNNSNAEMRAIYQQIESENARMVAAIENGTVRSLQELENYCEKISTTIYQTATESRRNIAGMADILTRSGMDAREVTGQIRDRYELPFKVDNEKRNIRDQENSLITDRDKPTNQIEIFTKLASTIGQCTFALQSFDSMVKTISDPDISAWEKLLSVVMNLSFMTPSLLQGVGAINNIRNSTRRREQAGENAQQSYRQQFAENKAQKIKGLKNNIISYQSKLNSNKGTISNSDNAYARQQEKTQQATQKLEKAESNLAFVQKERLQLEQQLANTNLSDSYKNELQNRIEAKKQEEEELAKLRDKAQSNLNKQQQKEENSRQKNEAAHSRQSAEDAELKRNIQDAQQRIENLQNDSFDGSVSVRQALEQIELADRTGQELEDRQKLIKIALSEGIDLRNKDLAIQELGYAETVKILLAQGNINEALKTTLQGTQSWWGGLAKVWKVAIGIGVAIAAVKLAMAAYDKWFSADAAEQEIQEVSDSLSNVQSELDELNNKLEDVNNQISEIQSKGTLSLTDQQELNKLQQEANLLEQQAEAAEKRLAAEKELYSVTFEKNFKQSTKDDMSGGDGTAWGTIKANFLKDTIVFDEESYDLEEATAFYQELISQGETEKAEQFKQKMSDMFGDMKTEYDQSLADYQTYLDSKTAKDEAYFEQVETMAAATSQETAGRGTYDSYMASIADMDSVSNYLNKLNETQLNSIKQMIADGASEQELYEYFKSLGIGGYQSFYDAIASQAQASGNFIDWYISTTQNNKNKILDSMDNFGIVENTQIDKRKLKATMKALSESEITGLMSNLNDADAVQNLLGITEEQAKNAGAKNGHEYAVALIAAIRAAFGLDNNNIFDDLDISKDVKQALESAYDDLDADDKTLFEELLMSFSEENLEQFAKDGVEAVQAYLNKYRQEQKAENVYSEIESTLEADSKGDKLFDFDIKDVKNYAKQLQTLAKTSDKVADSLESDEEAAAKVSFAMQRLSQGVKDLKDGYEDWIYVLKSDNDGLFDAPEQIEVLDNIRDVISNFLNFDLNTAVNGESLDMSWIKNHYKDLEDAANGSTEAIKRLQLEASKQIIVQIMGKADFSELDIELQNLTNDLSNWLAANQDKLQLGATIDDSQFNAALVNMAAATGKTVAEIAKAWGFEVSGQVGYTTVEVDMPNLGNYLSANSGAEFNGIGALRMSEYSNKTVLKLPKFTYVATSGASSSSLPTGLGTTSAPSSKKSGSKYDPDTLDDEFDKYHYYIKSLEDLGNAYERFAEKRNQAYTLEDYDLFHNSMISNLQSQLTMNQKYRDAVTNELLASKKQLSSWGIQFDGWGNMTNYYSWLENLKSTYQKKLNAAGSDEAAEKIKEEYQDKIDAVERNQELHETKRDLETTIEDLQRQIQEENLNQIKFHLEFENSEIELVLSELEAKLNHLGHYELVIPLLVDVQEDQLGQTLDKLQAQYEYLNNLEAEAAAHGMTNDLRVAIQEAKEGIYSLETEIEAFVDKIGEDLEAIFSNISDKASNGTAILGGYKDILNAMQQILSLSGKKYTDNKTYKFIEEAIQNATVKNLEVLKKQYAATNTAIKEMEQAYADLVAQGADDAVLKQWRDQINEAKQDFVDLSSELASAIETAISTVMEQMTAALEDSMHKAEMNLFDIGDLEMAQSYYQEYSDLAEEYLDNIEKAYELDKLMRNIESSLADSQNITGSKELAALAEEVAQHQADGAKMSQYEVDLLNAKYQLTLAQIALEEAQNNKTTMRLKRNASGNYTYVYTADESAVSKAEQDVADKEKNLYDISKEYEQKIQESWLNILQEYEERVQELQQKFQDGIINESEFLNQKAELDNIYKQKIDYVYGELNKVYENSSLVFADSVLSQVLNMDILTDAYESSYDFINEISVAATDNMREQQERVEEILDSVGTAVDDLADDFKFATDDISSSIDSVTIETIDGLNTIEDALAADIAAVRDWAAEVSAAFKEVASLRAGALDEDASSNSTVSAPDYSYEFMKYTAAGDSGTANVMWLNRQTKYNQLSDTQKSKMISQADLQTWASDYLNENSANHDKALKVYEAVMNGGSAYQAWNKYYGFDTGGYTGSWGSDGRLAVLHQKELVLNAQDTENILEAVKLIRSMSSMITSSLANDVINLLGQTSSFTNFNTNNNLVPQMVTIEASFPNVSVASEIEQAFNSLADQAAQYASIKKI